MIPFFAKKNVYIIFFYDFTFVKWFCIIIIDMVFVVTIFLSNYVGFSNCVTKIMNSHGTSISTFKV